MFGNDSKMCLFVKIKMFFFSQDLIQKMVKVGTTYFSPPSVIDSLADLFKCGQTVPDNVKGDANAAANTIRLRIDDFKLALPNGIASVRPNQRIEEISAAPGAAPTGITGVAVDFTADAGAGAADTGAVVQFQREHQALIVRRATAEISEREATTRAQTASAVYTEFQIAQAQKHAPLIDAKLTDEAETAALGKAAAAAVVRKADAEACLVEQAVDLKAAEARRQQEAEERARADAEEERSRKRKRDDDAAADVARSKAKEERDAAWASVKSQLKIYNDASDGERFAMKPEIRSALDALLRDEVPDAKQRTNRISAIMRRQKPKAPPQAGPELIKRWVYVRVGDGPQQYVGDTANPERRAQEHDAGVSGGGAAVVQRFKLYKYVEPLTAPRADSKAWESEETYRRMLMYGVDNVYGGKYASPYRSATKRMNAISDCCHAFNLCNRCAKVGHMITGCHESTYADWVGGGAITSPITE